VPDTGGQTILSGTLAISIVPGTLLARILGRTDIREAYTCSYELNPEYRDTLVAAGLRVSGIDVDGAVRAVELPDHRFYVATLFQPQRASEPGCPHPLVAAFLRAALSREPGRTER
jgi:CTP synthase (UTP-ammonia lyase)